LHLITVTKLQAIITHERRTASVANMKAPTLATLIFLTATASATPLKRAALFTGKDYEITKLNLQDNSKGNVTIRFTVHDPDPLTNATALCKGSWPHGSDQYPQDTYVCLRAQCSGHATHDPPR
jgi:hypothetical protein